MIFLQCQRFNEFVENTFCSSVTSQPANLLKTRAVLLNILVIQAHLGRLILILHKKNFQKILSEKKISTSPFSLLLFSFQVSYACTHTGLLRYLQEEKQ